MTAPKLTISDLDLCAPLFKLGEIAEEKLLEGEVLADEVVVKLETHVETKRLVFEYLVSQSDGLIRQEVNKLLKSSALYDAHEAFNQVYYAGVRGFAKGLGKYSPSVKKASPTNYLFQWVYTYAKRELLAIEAPLGVPPTRYEKMKKIAAVRRKYAEELGRAPSNEELLDFFHSGRADVDNKIGRVKNSGKASQANLKIKLEELKEQEEVERQMSIQLIDIQDSNLSERAFQVEDPKSFDETIFGRFVAEHTFSDRAIAVLRSELRDGSAPEVTELAHVDSMSEKEYKRLSRLWSDYLSHPASPFIEFMQRNGEQIPEEYSGSSNQKLDDSKYDELYEK